MSETEEHVAWSVAEERTSRGTGSRLLDLNLLVISSGRERSEAEYRVLLDAAGLRVTKVVPSVSPLSVIEAVRK